MRHWEAVDNFYTDQGIDCVTAWHKTNKFFGMGQKELARFEKERGIDIDSIGITLEYENSS